MNLQFAFFTIMVLLPLQICPKSKSLLPHLPNYTIVSRYLEKKANVFIFFYNSEGEETSQTMKDLNIISKLRFFKKGKVAN